MIRCKDTGEIAWTYKGYAQTVHWKTKRKEYMGFRFGTDEPECEICKKRDVWLLIHHKTYQNITNEKMEDLICLCSECHFKQHFGRESDPNLNTKGLFTDERQYIDAAIASRSWGRLQEEMYGKEVLREGDEISIQVGVHETRSGLKIKVKMTGVIERV